MLFRKFLLGQCNKNLLTMIPFNDCQLSSKKLFDDTYLYFMEQQNNYHRPLNDVALGIYELMNHSQVAAGSGQSSLGEVDAETIPAEINNSYLGQQMLI